MINSSIVYKTYSILLSFCIVLSINVVALDNIVTNGNFDTTLNNWSVINSPQFSLSVVNNQAQFNGDGMSLWWDINSKLDDGTYYNLSKTDNINISINGQTINSFLTLEGETEELIINPNFVNNLTWNYTESGAKICINGTVDELNETFIINSINKQDLVKYDYGYGQINQTTTTLKDGFIDASVMYKHGFYNTSGAINSGMTLNISDVHYEVYNEITENNISWTSGNIFDIYTSSGSEITTILNTTHDLIVQENGYTTKITSWDNCYVNLTSYASNGTYISDVVNALDQCSWSQLVTYTDFDLSEGDEEQTLYFRKGNVETPDGTWSSWINLGEPYEITLESGVYKNIYNLTGFEQYCQYKVEWVDNISNTSPNRFYGSLFSGVLSQNNIGSSSLVQSVSKPYTNFTLLEYDQQVLINDIVDANITVMFGDYLVTKYNITEFNESTNHYSFNLPSSFNSMGQYDLNFTVTTTFASPNVTVSRIPMDVVFALDTSGSMTSGDMDNLKLATKNLIGIMNETDRVAIFTYSGGSNEVARPELQREYEYMDSTNKASFNITIDGITDRGYTPFYDTVGDAINYTQTNKIDGRLEYVIAMTDGESNSDDYWTPETTWGNKTTNDPNDYDSDDWMQNSGGLKGILNAPCIVYTVGLGISHDINYPSAPNWSQTAPEPSTGIEYDVWNVANSSPYPTCSDGGKYGKNETGEDNIGHYYFTEDSSDLIEIFQTIYVDTYTTKSSGVDSSCIVNIDNVKVLITPQAPNIISFFVKEITPIDYEFYGTFIDLTLGEDYDFDSEGIESIYIVVGHTFNLTVENITYLGDGIFEFQYMWFHASPSVNSTTILDSYVTITDKAGFVGIGYVEFVEPNILSVLVYIGCFILVYLILIKIFYSFRKTLDIKK